MDLFSSLSMAARSLQAQSLGLDATGQNIANINTPGYTRRVVNFVAVPPRSLLSAGDGADVASITGERAPFLDARIRSEQPIVAREAAISSSLTTIQTAFGAPGESIDSSLNDFFDAFSTLAQDPTSPDARYQMAAQGQSLALAFNNIDGRLTASQWDADGQIRADAGQVNALTATLASINTQLAGQSGSVTEALKDQQNVVLSKLSDLIDVTTLQHADGSIDVVAANGAALVASGYSYQLTATPGPPTGFSDLSINGASVTNQITGGQIGGLLHVRDVLIPGYKTQLDNLAYGVAASVNTAHKAGFDLSGAPGGNFFSPIAAAAGAAKAITLNPAILASPQLIAAAGAPSPGDNQAARTLANLRSATITGGTANPLDTWSTIVYQVATDLNSSRQENTNRGDIVTQLQSLRDQYSGVSLDEEAASLMKFQRAYEANAKFFSTVNQTLNTLMALAA